MQPIILLYSITILFFLVLCGKMAEQCNCCILAGAVVYFVRATLSATLLTLICIKVGTVYRHVQRY